MKRLDTSNVKEGMHLVYCGESWAFGGKYKIVKAESTYLNPEDCPSDEKGTFMIIEFMNDGTPMYFNLNSLNDEEWKIEK